MPRILNIEDDADLQKITAQALQREGFEVHYAYTGPEGYEKILSLNPDLLILDMMLPGMNGAEVLRAARAHAHLRDIPVIAATSYPKDGKFLEQTVRALGVVVYLAKPVRLSELVFHVKRLLDGRAARTPPVLRLRKGIVRVDPKLRTIWVGDQRIATLAPRRMALLARLVQSEGEVSRRQLIDDIWPGEVDENVLEKTIERLRRDMGGYGRLVLTTAAGYELADRGQAAFPADDAPQPAGIPPTIREH